MPNNPKAMATGHYFAYSSKSIDSPNLLNYLIKQMELIIFLFLTYENAPVSFLFSLFYTCSPIYLHLQRCKDSPCFLPAWARRMFNWSSRFSSFSLDLWASTAQTWGASRFLKGTLLAENRIDRKRKENVIHVREEKLEKEDEDKEIELVGILELKNKLR